MPFLLQVMRFAKLNSLPLFKPPLKSALKNTLPLTGT